ncbi:protein arginine N-methyltransferase 5 [Eurytemora carolleeae]|uniref:protein arginine N-methyltransferase 5 n=1 Tax=Eurytemora carolleeae TaxID=1294199 RepID=UPI000C792E1E|nr:protein arginine N-methyltransferase 5 [Eurytemora carolleeae]|eukprot:XP_023343008.1 protein arginine N-methyltransferase 5-like [Eurytemora affinis]
MSVNRKRASCGLEIANPTDLDACITAGTHSNYDFICVPIVHPRYAREFDPHKPAYNRNAPLTRADILLAGSDWSSYVVGKLDTSINVDSVVPSIRKISEAKLTEELKYASHLGLPAVMVRLTGEHQPNLARILSNSVCRDQGIQIWAQVPISSADCNKYEDLEPGREIISSWSWWNRFRLLGNMSSKINLCLEMVETIPEEIEVLRWLGEPIKEFMNDTNDPLCSFARGFEDFLQIPLQPLMDNLESSTYEVFERDPVKYSQYLAAMQAAITDMIPEEEKATKVLTVMVVGAGRGPLVKAAISASKNAGRLIRVFAVEKNPNAIVTLHHLKIEEWKDQVTVISSDMRDWNPPAEDYADILVSELLGSFGDNELSPECLDGAQKFLKPGGISIPSSYTSFIGPIQSSKLFNEYRNSKDDTKHPKAAFETPYVVHLLNRVELDEPQPLFTFDHPNLDRIIDNSRFKELDFKIRCDSVLHGFGGYFECTLYKNIMISILPATHSPEMFSWFPIMFPLLEPLQMKRGENLKLNFWRCVSKHHVWYEWSISEPICSPVHNPNGRSYQIGL